MCIDLSNVTAFGCVILVDEIPHLCILDNDILLDGIPLFDDNEFYTTLYDNELIIVGISVKDEEGNEIDDYNYIDDDNYDELTYTVTPLKIHTLKTPGLVIEDIIDLDFLDLLVGETVDEYLNNIG